MTTYGVVSQLEFRRYLLRGQWRSPKEVENSSSRALGSRGRCSGGEAHGLFCVRDEVRVQGAVRSYATTLLHKVRESNRKLVKGVVFAVSEIQSLLFAEVHHVRLGAGVGPAAV
jgi:hypothetical protein